MLENRINNIVQIQKCLIYERTLVVSNRMKTVSHDSKSQGSSQQPKDSEPHMLAP